jgi:hypothetical protein
MVRLIRLLACLAVLASAGVAAERSAVADTWVALQKVHAEELAAFALALDAKDGSVDAEARSLALALAKKLDPTLKAKEPPRKAMSAEDQAADKAAREAAAARDQAREAAEKTAPAPAPLARDYPKPENARERFDALRFEILCDEVEHLSSLSANPESRTEAPLRQAALKSLQSLIGAPRWACEKALKERVAELAGAKYAPWTGVWTTRLGDLTLTQTDDKVAGFWKRDPASETADGTLQAVVKDRTLTGTWKTAAEQGTITVVLSRSDRYWKGTTKDKADVHPLDGKRAEAPAPAATK